MVDIRLVILATTILFTVLFALEYRKNRQRGLKSLAFGIRWTIVGLYVAMVEVAIRAFDSEFYYFVSFVLAIMALGFLQHGLTRLEDHA